MNKKFQPSNGTSGASFIEDWCGNCARDKPMSEGKDFDECSDDEICEIIGLTFALRVDDPEYPEEWTYDDAGQPICTAFIPACESVKSRCIKTADMFNLEDIYGK